MKKKGSFKKRILLSFSIIIAIFTISLIFFEEEQIKKERTYSLERSLENSADIVHSFLETNRVSVDDSARKAQDILQYLPNELRLTIIHENGKVLFDNRLNENTMENHFARPEIKKTIASGSGSNIRVSSSDGIKYLYFAKIYPEDYFIRVALPYDIEVESFINSDNTFAFFILLFFIICIAMMLYFVNRFTRSIRQLKEFSLKLKSGQPVPPSFAFSDDEVGEVSAEIVENYNLLQDNRRKVLLEREKLLQHFQYSEEGIAIYSKDWKIIYANSHFMQYLNEIIDKPTLQTEYFFSDPNFSEFTDFLKNESRKENMFAKRLNKNGKKYQLRILIFDDESFELYISDITKAEKTRLLKQEMTNNIAHELRTPVTSIRGYLETLQSMDDNDVERRNNFLERAYFQSIRLSELIQDIGMLTKIEEAADRFELEPVQMKPLLDELGSDLRSNFLEKNVTYTVDVDENVVVYGSRTLLYSIFRNLAENAVAYAGPEIEVCVRCYMENNEAYYFEFYDTGKGVEEKHLVRMFERFYRINEGRTRNTGGSGLGLSIVKNAVLFHKGSIVAKNRPEGGLSFLLTFPKTSLK